MASRKEYFGKYCSSDIFNLNQKSALDEERPKLRMNRSSLENTKSDVFNIGKERRINRNHDRDIYFSNSAEKRKKNYEKIYGSDIFNLRAKSVERRNGRHHMPNMFNRSTCFEEMKNNEEYVEEFKQYTREKRGDNDNNKYHIRTMENVYNNDKQGEKYIKKRTTDIIIDSEKKSKNILYRNQKNNSILNFRKKHPLTIYSNEKRHFVDLEEYRENNCKINKQLQFESHLFSNQDNNYFNTKEHIKEINSRINKGRYTSSNNLNVLGQPKIRVNRRKRNEDNIHSSMCELHPKKIGPATMTWDNPQSQVMFSPDYSKNLYKNYGPNPTAYQRSLFQFADSDFLDTLSGLKKNYENNFKNIKKPKTDEIKNKEEQKKIEKILGDIPNLSEGQKLEIKMKSSILDFRDDKELDNKTKELNNFLKKEKTKKKEVTDKVNHIDNKKIENNKNFNDYIITYGIKGNNFEKYSENEIKKIFGQKGINVYDIHKNNFSKGRNFNTIELKITGNNINNELNKKIKLIQDDLIKKNCKVKIEKIKKSNNIKKSINNPGGKVAIMKENTSNIKDGSKFKLMPNEYKKKGAFTKQFSGINYSYKNPYLLY